MRDGKHADGAHVLRAKIDMALAEHQPARPGALPHPPRAPPPHRRQVVHLPDVRLRAPASRTRSRTSRTRSARSSSRTSGRSTTGCSSAWPKAGLLRAAAAAADRVRAAQPDLRGHQQAQADAAGRRKARRRLGRPAHADDRRRAPPRLHAGRLPPVRRAHRRVQGEPADRLRHARGLRCATT